MVGLILGVLLIIIAIILFVVQYATKFAENIKWDLRALFVIIGLIGLILAVWSLMKKKALEKPAKPA
jgi:multisubunit Na+/H+ antiporter MnhB subunit